MGLDMTLYRKHYVKNYGYQPPADRHAVLVTRGGSPLADIKPDRIAVVLEEVAYWRKANAIHKWFVDNVQHGEDNCSAYYVSNEKLKELLEKINTVLAKPDQAEKILPTFEGFFYGSYEYDDWYFKDLEDTRDVITALLDDQSPVDYEYTSSW